MRAAWHERQGAAREVLTVGEMPDPEPGAAAIRIRIEASGVDPGTGGAVWSACRKPARKGFRRVSIPDECVTFTQGGIMSARLLVAVLAVPLVPSSAIA